MTREENRAFVKKSESLAKPRDITSIAFLGDFNKFLPLKVQRSFVKKGSEKVPYMGFLVEPYGFFLSYGIRDEAAATSLLPDGYELADAGMFRNDGKRPLVIFSAFSARTSAFMGMRLECYIIARRKATGAMAWIIADYLTNTNSHDPKNGFCGYNADPALHTVTPYGELLVDVKGAGRDGEFAVRADLGPGSMEALDEDLWVQGNMTVDYGGVLKDETSRPFSLIFDPVLMAEAVRIPLEGVVIEKNSFLEGIIDPMRPEGAAVFPYSQHFIIRQDLEEGAVAGKEDLLKELRTFLGRNGFKPMSGDDLKKPIFRGMIVSSILNLGIILLLIALLVF